MDQRPTDEQPPTPFPRLSGDGGEYDALADLFLGDPELGPRPATVNRARHAPPPIPTPEGGPVPRSTPEPARPAVVEAVLLGHLPVRASIWVRQYASAVGSSLGRPVGLLRIGPEASSVELVGPGAERLAVSAEEPAEELGEALRRVAGMADRWIIRVEEAAEAGLAECEGVDEVTILTGSDEAAVVASYRLVKSLAAAWDQTFGSEAGPTLGLAIMGSSGEQALAAGEKLERAAAAFLNRPVRVTARVPKIGVSAAATVYRGAEALDARQLIAIIRAEPATPLRLAEDGWQEAGAAGETTPSGVVAEEPHAEAAAPVSAVLTPPEPETSDAGVIGTVESEAFEEIEFDTGTQEDAAPGEPEVGEAAESSMADECEPDLSEPHPPEPDLPEPVEAAPVIVTRRMDQVVPRRIERPAPQPARTPAPAADSVEASESDASLAGLIGLRPIETRCPYAGRVEMAVDGDGWLHLVIEEGRDGAEAVSQLMAAQSWVRAHLSLLLRAEPLLAQPTSREAPEPMLHLLTRSARAARPLLDAEVRLHLVTRVSLGGRTGWVASELN